MCASACTSRTAGIFTDTQPLAKLAPGLWFIALELPIDSYLEYSFYDPKTKQRVADPLNRHRYWNGIHAYNHYFYMPGAAPTPLARRKPGIPRGALGQNPPVDVDVFEVIPVLFDDHPGNAGVDDDSSDHRVPNLPPPLGRPGRSRRHGLYSLGSAPQAGD